MADCLHKNQMKLFIIKRHVYDSIPDHAGYSICPDCDDYLITGWVQAEEVWTTDDVYSMTETIGEEDHKITPIGMFLNWIRDDLKDFVGEDTPQMLSP